jgi:hypothetical protein
MADYGVIELDRLRRNGEGDAPMATTEPVSHHAMSHQEQARRHLWMHFSRMGAYDADHEIPVIARGDGCHVWDDNGKRSARCSA